MDFCFTEEQLMIRDTAAAFLDEVAGSAALRRALASPDLYADSWPRIVDDMGWQALVVPEAEGGLGLGMVELALVLEQCGARLLASPLFATAGVVTPLIRSAACAAREHWLPGIAAGEVTWALGLQAPGAPWGHGAPGLRYRRDGERFLLSGEVACVVDGASAQRLLLVAAAGESAGGDGLRLFSVAGDAPGLERRRRYTLDQTRPLAALTLKEVAVEDTPAGVGEACDREQLAAGLDLATIALAAEALGAAQQSLDMAVAYTLERQQFGRPIAGFQAVKHKAADMMLRVECARSALYYAACTADSWYAGGADAAALAEAASIAKASCGDAAFANAGEALQLHGGNGFTWEYDVHLYFKRARAARALFGSSDWHRERIATRVLDGAGEPAA